MGFPGSASGNEPTCQCRSHEIWVRSLGREDPLEEGTVTHSSILDWRIPWTEEPGGLYPVQSQRVGDLAQHCPTVYSINLSTGQRPACLSRLISFCLLPAPSHSTLSKLFTVLFILYGFMRYNNKLHMYTV